MCCFSNIPNHFQRPLIVAEICDESEEALEIARALIGAAVCLSFCAPSSLLAI